MTSQLKTFEFIPGISLRVIDRDGDPWFVAKDVCDALDLRPDATNGSLQNHMRRLDDDEYITAPLPSASGTRKQYIVSESGFYSLVLRSKKPEAKSFKRWVTSVVLLAIRKDGGYFKGEETAKTDDEIAYLGMQAMQRKIDLTRAR